MTRKDTEKDSDRPHYYSQFWLDVAAGRRVIGAPKPEESEGAEPEVPEPAPAPRRSARATQNDYIDSRASDGHSDNIVHPVAEPITTPDVFIEPEAEEYEESDDLGFDSSVEEEDIPDMDLGIAEEDEDEEAFEEEEDEDEEEDIGWGGTRGRKKPKPGRVNKPLPKKPGRREPRRGY